MNPLYPPVAERAQRRCEYCHAPEDVFNFPFEVEHIMPQARGGSDDLVNLALACHACNLYKSDFETGSDEDTQAFATLFNPRLDVWAQHFRVDMENAVIVGLTPIGRATINRLQVNHVRQVTARRRWIQWGMYP